MTLPRKHVAARARGGWFVVRLGGALIVVVGILSVTSAQAPQGKELRNRAAERVAAYRDYARKTGDSASRAKDLERAVEELNRAFRTFSSAGQLSEAAACRNDAGEALRHLNRFDEAFPLYEEGKKLARQANASAELARAHLGQCRIALYRTKDYEAAASSAELAIRASASTPAKEHLFEAYCLRGDVDLRQGSFYAAVTSYQNAFERAPPAQDKLVILHAFNDRGECHFELSRRNLGDLDYADREARLGVADARSALAIAEKEGWDYLAQGARLALKSRLLQVEAVRLSVLKINTDVFKAVKPGDVLVTQEFLADGKMELPAEMVRMVESWDKEGPSQAARLSTLGHFASLAGRRQEALDRYREAIARVEQDYESLGDIEARLNHLLPNVHFYTWPMAALLQEGNVAEAFRVMELARARTLADLLLTREKAALANPKERDRYEQLRAVRARMTEQSAAHRRLPDHQAGGDKARTIAKELERLRSEYQALLKEVRAQAPDLLQLVTAEPASLAAVEDAAAKGNYDLLEYVVMPNQVVVWHIGKSGAHVASVFLTQAVLRHKVKALQASLIEPNRAFDADAARQLFLFLVQPMLRHVTTKHLVIVPHEELCYLPFGVLQDWPEGRYLDERFRISYAPSATILLRLPAAGKLAGSAVLAVAGPELADALPEAEAIAKLYPGSKVVPRDQATEAYLRRVAGNYDVLHVAAHASFDGREPLRSSVHLTARDADDGKLTAAEMFGLRLGRSRLVALSACESGQATGASATEMIGMPRALIHAGAPAVLLSYWRVDSRATRAWMQAFYGEAAGAPLAEAARRAAAAVRQQPGYGHPYYWGAFYLIGR